MSSSAVAAATGLDTSKEDDQLRAYSKELYTYTLGKLEEVNKSDDSKKGGAATAKTYVLKRRQSDGGTSRKDDGASS